MCNMFKYVHTLQYVCTSVYVYSFINIIDINNNNDLPTPLAPLYLYDTQMYHS